MANSTKEVYEMILIRSLPPFVCLGILVLPSLIIQSFTVAVNVIDWLKGRPLMGADKLITSNELSKVFFHTASLLYFFAIFYFAETSSIFFISLQFVINFSACFCNCLSSMHFIFIYFKMSTFHNVFYLRLKAIVLRKIIYLIVASVLLSLAFSLTHLFSYPIQAFSTSIQNFILRYKQNQKTMPFVNLLWNMWPFLLGFLSQSMLIISLVIHMVRMNNVTSSTDTYQRTIRFTFLCMLIWVMHIITYISGEYLRLLGPWYVILMNIFPGLHSVLLIYAATKLRAQFFSIVHCGTDCLFNRKAPGPHSRESEEVTAL